MSEYKVFVVCTGYGYEHMARAAFSTREKAEEFEKSCDRETEIEEFEIDKPN